MAQQLRHSYPFIRLPREFAAVERLNTPEFLLKQNIKSKRKVYLFWQSLQVAVTIIIIVLMLVVIIGGAILRWNFWFG